MRPIFKVAPDLVRCLRAALLYALKWKLDHAFEILDLYAMRPLEILGMPEYLLQRCKHAMLRLFRDYLDPIGLEKGMLLTVQLGF